MDTTFNRLIRRHLLRMLQLLLLLAAITIGGALGFRLLLGWDWLESFYMTVITVTTVGFGEIRDLGAEGRVFTMILMVSSVGTIAYAATSLTSLAMDREFHSILRIRRMEKSIAKLRGHYILCGFGRTGREVAQNLDLDHQHYVVVESNAGNQRLLQEQNRQFISGDATNDQALLKAGIVEAKGLVAALGNDAENVYLVLSARQLNTRLNIVAWASTAESAGKVRRAGADHVISPYLLGGKRIAYQLTSPHAMAFWDTVMGDDENIRLGEIPIEAGSSAAGKPLKSSGISRDIGVILIGIRRKDGTMIFNPSQDIELRERDVLIGIGSLDQIQRLKQLV